MTWIQIDASTINGNDLALYESDGVYMVRVGGMELMSGHWHQSEDLLGRLAFLTARTPQPRILLGGLGLGYSLASLSAEMGNDGTIVVAEISSAIIGWFERYLRAALFPVMPANIEIVETDISDLIRAGSVFDVIALDVDNGPEALSSEGNSFLYGYEGLNALGDCLAPGGTLLVWSSFESEHFVARAEEIGFHVRCLPVVLTSKSNSKHFLYFLSLSEMSLEEFNRLAA